MNLVNNLRDLFSIFYKQTLICYKLKSSSREVKRAFAARFSKALRVKLSQALFCMTNQAVEKC